MDPFMRLGVPEYEVRKLNARFLSWSSEYMSSHIATLAEYADVMEKEYRSPTIYDDLLFTIDLTVTGEGASVQVQVSGIDSSEYSIRINGDYTAFITRCAAKSAAIQRTHIKTLETKVETLESNIAFLKAHMISLKAELIKVVTRLTGEGPM